MAHSHWLSVTDRSRRVRVATQVFDLKVGGQGSLRLLSLRLCIIFIQGWRAVKVGVRLGLKSDVSN